MVRGRICIDDITEHQLNRYRCAVCIQAEKLYAQGGVYGSRYSGISGLKSVSVGDFSMSGSAPDSGDYVTDLSYAAENILEECGLLYRGGVKYD